MDLTYEWQKELERKMQYQLESMLTRLEEEGFQPKARYFLSRSASTPGKESEAKSSLNSGI